MFKVTKYPHGTFCWADCNSTDPAKGKQFYAQLMGWDTDDLPLGDGMIYTMFKQGGSQVAAIGPMNPNQPPMPSFWSSYVKVDDSDALVKKVTEAGGTVILEPMDVFDSGRMTMIQDPTGAFLGLWQPQNHIGAQLVNTPGAMTWNELATRDSQKARDFLGHVFGWQFQKAEHMDYYYILNRGRMNGGIMQMDASWGDIPANWMVYFSVKDIDATAAKASSLGGKLMQPIMEASGTGRFAIIADPQGAVSSFIQLVEPQTWSE